MTDLEDRLHSALDAAVPDLDVPDGLVAGATRRAVRLRRRRAATHTALGVAAVAVSGTALWPSGTPRTSQVAPLSSPSASPTAVPAASSVRVTYAASCKHPLTGVPGTCTRMSFAVRQPDGTVQNRDVWDRFTTDGEVAEPASVAARFSDGSRAVFPARADGPSSWVFDITAPEGATVRTLTVRTADGEPLLRADLVGD